MRDIYDTERTAEDLARQKPWWTPGSTSGHHAISQGHLVGEIIRRVTGRTLKDFIRDEITGPLGADFQSGALEKDWGQISKIVLPPSLPFSAPDDGSVTSKTLKSSPVQATNPYDLEFRRAELGALNGFRNARSLNAILSIIMTGGVVNGKRFLSQPTIDRIFEEQSNGVDLVISITLHQGIEYGLPESKSAPWIPEGKVCFWGAGEARS